MGTAGPIVWLAVACAFHFGLVMCQDLPDLGDLGDILDELDLGDINIFGTEKPSGNSHTAQNDGAAPNLKCYECGTSSQLMKSQLTERACITPSTATTNVTCKAPPSGFVNHCGWMEATVATPNPDNPAEKMELYWLFRGCVAVTTKEGVADKCFEGADLLSTLSRLGLSPQEITGAGMNSTITGKGCFCGTDYCNSGAPAAVWFPTLTALVAMMATVRAIFN